MSDLDKYTDAQLTKLAGRAFRLGLEHGRTLSGPVDSVEVMIHLNVTAHFRIFHRKKLRQVYGAGFDISRQVKAVNQSHD